MPLFRTLPIMPKESKAPTMTYAATAAPYPLSSSSLPRNAAIWSSGDDEILLQARASGLNWQPIASRHFPNKTANACRKRHERLIERRHVEDWDAQKLELLAQEYVAIRKEIWEMLASRVGERWAVVEAKVSKFSHVCRDTRLTDTSAWRRVSRTCKQPLARLKERPRQARAVRAMTVQVRQITIATLALAWAQTLRWS